MTPEDLTNPYASSLNMFQTPISKAIPNMDMENKIGVYTLLKEFKNFFHHCSSYRELMNAINHQPIIFSFMKKNLVAGVSSRQKVGKTELVAMYVQYTTLPGSSL